MAKSRQQLINSSSFLSDQKEKIGGLNVKKSTITGAKFKKGTSQESVDNIEDRVSGNEKKITLLKRIVKLRKKNVDKQLGGSPLLESLQAIASTVDSIRDTLIKQQDNDKSVAESMRREKEEDERKGQEKGLESRPQILQKVGDVVMKPVMGLFGRIFNFLKTLFLGKILMNFIDWFSNPANQGKIQTLVRFVKDWWPALTAAVLLFGTGFGGLVAGLIKTIMFFIPAMGKAIVALKSAKFLSMIPGGGKIGAVVKTVAPIAIGAGVGYSIGRMQGGGEEQPQEFNKGGKVPGRGANKDTVPAMLTPGEFVMSRDAVDEWGVDTLAGMNAAAGGTNTPTLKKVKVPHYNKGGNVSEMSRRQQIMRQTDETGTFGEDGWSMSTFQATPEQRHASYKEMGIPSMELWDGSVVPDFGKMGKDKMLKGIAMTREGLIEGGAPQDVIDKLNSLETMQVNGMAGPDYVQNTINRLVPGSQAQVYGDLGDDISASAKMKGGGLVQGFQGGGLVTPYNYLVEQGLKVEDLEDGLKRMVRVYNPDKVDKKTGKHQGTTIMGTYKGKDQVPTEQFINGMFSIDQLKIIKHGKKSKLRGGFERMVGGTADQLTGNLFDFDKKSGGGLIRKTAGAFGGLFGGGKKEGGSKGGSSGILGPISSDVDAMVDRDKYEVKPKEKKNTVVAYQQAVNEQQQEVSQAEVDGNEIPSFTLRPDFMVDEAKVDVLGIMV